MTNKMGPRGFPGNPQYDIPTSHNITYTQNYPFIFAPYFLFLLPVFLEILLMYLTSFHFLRKNEFFEVEVQFLDTYFLGHVHFKDWQQHNRADYCVQIAIAGQSSQYNLG